MSNIGKEDIINLARISNIEIQAHELDEIAHHLSAVLTYAQRVIAIARDVEQTMPYNVNIMRDDVIARTDANPILQQAPARVERYFMVPAIIEHS